MRELQKPQIINKIIGHKRTKDLDPPLAHNSPIDLAIATIPPQSISTTINPSQFIMPPDASDVRKLKKSTFQPTLSSETTRARANGSHATA